MDYPIRVPGFEHLDLVLRASMFGGASLLDQVIELPAGAKLGEYLLTRADGTLQPVKFAPRLLSLDLPRLRIGDDVIDIVEPLTPLQWIWCGLPILLALMGGAVGVFVGFVALTLSTRVLRSRRGLALRYVASGAVSALAVAIYVALAMALSGAWSPQPARSSLNAPSLPLTSNGAVENNAAFTVVFPSPPSESDQISTSDNGQARRAHSWVSEIDGATFTVVSWYEPDALKQAGGLDAFFERALKRYTEANIKAHNFTIEGQVTPVSLRGVPGVAYKAAVATSTRRMWGRVYLNGTHAYSLTVVSRDSNRSEEAFAFLDSFTLHNPQTAPKAAPPGPG